MATSEFDFMSKQKLLSEKSVEASSSMKLSPLKENSAHSGYKLTNPFVDLLYSSEDKENSEMRKEDKTEKHTRKSSFSYATTPPIDNGVTILTPKQAEKPRIKANPLARKNSFATTPPLESPRVKISASSNSPNTSSVPSRIKISTPSNSVPLRSALRQNNALGDITNTTKGRISRRIPKRVSIAYNKGNINVAGNRNDVYKQITRKLSAQRKTSLSPIPSIIEPDNEYAMDYSFQDANLSVLSGDIKQFKKEHTEKSEETNQMFAEYGNSVSGGGRIQLSDNEDTEYESARDFSSAGGSPGGSPGGRATGASSGGDGNDGNGKDNNDDNKDNGHNNKKGRENRDSGSTMNDTTNSNGNVTTHSHDSSAKSSNSSQRNVSRSAIVVPRLGSGEDLYSNKNVSVMTVETNELMRELIDDSNISGILNYQSKEELNKEESDSSNNQIERQEESDSSIEYSTNVEIGNRISVKPVSKVEQVKLIRPLSDASSNYSVSDPFDPEEPSPFDYLQPSHPSESSLGQKKSSGSLRPLANLSPIASIGSSGRKDSKSPFDDDFPHDNKRFSYSFRKSRPGRPSYLMSRDSSRSLSRDSEHPVLGDTSLANENTEDSGFKYSHDISSSFVMFLEDSKGVGSPILRPPSSHMIDSSHIEHQLAHKEFNAVYTGNYSNDSMTVPSSGYEKHYKEFFDTDYYYNYASQKAFILLLLLGILLPPVYFLVAIGFLDRSIGIFSRTQKISCLLIGVVYLGMVYACIGLSLGLGLGKG